MRRSKLPLGKSGLSVKIRFTLQGYQVNCKQTCCLECVIFRSASPREADTSISTIIHTESRLVLRDSLPRFSTAEKADETTRSDNAEARTPCQAFAMQ
jgi:hypothetical protein